MVLKILIGVFIIVVFMGPVMALMDGELQNIKEQKQDIIKLKLNPTEVLYFLFINGLTFALSQLLLLWLIVSSPANFPIVLFLIIIPFVFLSSIDIVILITHIINEKRRIIYWDKNQGIFSVNQNRGTFQIDLKSDSLQIVHYYPPIQGSRGFPGFNYHVIVLSDNGFKLRISSITYDNYNFFLPLTKHKNFLTIKRQFNVLI